MPRRRQPRAPPPTTARSARRWQALKQTASPHSLCSSLAQWFQMTKFRRKQVYPECFHEFCGFSKFLQIYITSVSGYLSFTFKTCQIVAGASMIHQFHEFFEISFLAGFCNLAQLCLAAVARRNSSSLNTASKVLTELLAFESAEN